MCYISTSQEQRKEDERDGDYDQESEDSSFNDDVIDSWMTDGDKMWLSID